MTQTRRRLGSTIWQFLTGGAEDLETVLRAFDSDHAEKTHYGPVTFLRPAPGKPWAHINGIVRTDWSLLVEMTMGS